MSTATLPHRVSADEATVGLGSGWDLVVAEIRESCARRAGTGELFRSHHAVGVRSGASPVLWVHGPGDTDLVANVVVGSPEVDDVYVSADAAATRRRLADLGWVSAGSVTQLVCDRENWTAGDAPGIRELTGADLPEFRRVLAAATDADDRLLASSYGPDFFERAHPAWLFGAYDGAALVGTVGMRLQQRSAMVFALAVDGEARGGGVAADLVRTAIRQAFLADAEFVHALAEPASLRVGLAAGARAVGTWEHLVRP
jgi:GNAT superfamily N-acetyltransferase